MKNFGRDTFEPGSLFHLEITGSNLLGHIRFGFAAGCAAVAMPRRKPQNYSGLRPSFGLGPRCWSKVLIKGIAQGKESLSTAGHSHRRTSGGKAEANSKKFNWLGS